MPESNDVIENAVVSLPAKPKKEGGLLSAFLPNQIISPNIMRLLIGAEAAIFLVIWLRSAYRQGNGLRWSWGLATRIDRFPNRSG